MPGSHDALWLHCVCSLGSIEPVEKITTLPQKVCLYWMADQSLAYSCGSVWRVWTLSWCWHCYLGQPQWLEGSLPSHSCHPWQLTSRLVWLSSSPAWSLHQFADGMQLTRGALSSWVIAVHARRCEFQISIWDNRVWNSMESYDFLRNSQAIPLAVTFVIVRMRCMHDVSQSIITIR